MSSRSCFVACVTISIDFCAFVSYLASITCNSHTLIEYSSAYRVWLNPLQLASHRRKVFKLDNPEITSATTGSTILIQIPPLRVVRKGRQTLRPIIIAPERRKRSLAWLAHVPYVC